MAGSILRCSLLVVDASHSDGRRVVESVVCTTSRWPMNLDANSEVPPCSLAEQRRYSGSSRVRRRFAVSAARTL